MKHSPRWGRRSILQLNWVFDSFFVTPSVYREVFEPFGIGSIAVVDSDGVVLDDVVQLKIEHTAEVDVGDAGLVSIYCGECGVTKYEPSDRGFFPRTRVPESVHLAVSDVHFGSDASASRAVIVSQKLWGAIQKAKVRGASGRPAR